MLQPLFTDNIELSKYAGKNKIQALKVPFSGLERLLAKEAAGYMLNPAGFHIIVTRQQLGRLREHFTDTPSDITDKKE